MVPEKKKVYYSSLIILIIIAIVLYFKMPQLIWLPLGIAFLIAFFHKQILTLFKAFTL